MAEEAQELTVTNAGQPHATDIGPAEDREDAQELQATMPTTITAAIDPSQE